MRAAVVFALAAMLTRPAAGQAPVDTTSSGAALGPASSVAPEPSPEPAGYNEAIDEAVREFSARNYEEARSLFARAHALYPNARTERGLGLAQFELRNYAESIRHFEAALRSSVKPLGPELRKDTESMLARANNFVARVRLDIKGTNDAEVSVDGVRAEVEVDGVLFLTVGDHVLEVKAAGFAAERRKVSVQGGEERTLTLLLSPHAPAAPSHDAHRAWYKNPWLWTGVGVVVAGAAAGTAYALTRPESTPRPYGGTADALFTGP